MRPFSSSPISSLWTGLIAEEARWGLWIPLSLIHILRIYIPLSKPILATLALFIGVGKWNDWFTGAYYQSKAALYPAATVLQKILSEATASSQVKVGQETALGSMTSYTSQSLQMAFVMIPVTYTHLVPRM